MDPNIRVEDPKTLGFNPERLEKIAPAMQAFVDDRRLPNIVTLVARKGRIAHLHACGFQSLETGEEISSGTLFRLYSNTKPLAAVAMLILFERGILSPDDPVSRFIPELGEGLVIETGGGVCSGKLPIDSPADFYIAGSFDHLAKLKDGTHAVIDDKTSSARPENLLAEKQSTTYASQVNAYAYALEKPGTQHWIDKVYESKNHVNSRRMVPKIARKKICVSRLGLNNFTIDSLAHTTNGAFNFTTNRVWAEVGKDYDSLFGLCQKIADISVNSAPPESSQDCNFCKDFRVHKKWRNM